MLGLEIVVALGVAVLVGNLLAHRFGVAVTVVLLAAGLLLSLFPAFRGVGLPPEVVLLRFLPALLFWESLTTSLREIRRFLRGIILTGTLLVVSRPPRWPWSATPSGCPGGRRGSSVPPSRPPMPPQWPRSAAPCLGGT